MSSMNLGLDLPEKGIDLALLVFDVAQECNNTRRHTINFGALADSFKLQLDIFEVQQENSHLPEDEIQKRVDAITTEHKLKEERLAAEKVAKKSAIKQYINGNAIEGYELAYNLCKEDNSDRAKALSFRLLSHLPTLPVEEKIEICHIYAESLIDLGERGDKIAEVYCRMARLVYPRCTHMDYSLCLRFYENAYEYIDAPTRTLGEVIMLDEIIAFCNRFGIDELQKKCEAKKDIL